MPTQDIIFLVASLAFCLSMLSLLNLFGLYCNLAHLRSTRSAFLQFLLIKGNEFYASSIIAIVSFIFVYKDLT